MAPAGYGAVNTRFSFTVDVNPGGGGKAVYIKYDGTAYYGAFNVNLDDGTSVGGTFPTLTTSYQLDNVFSSKVVSITKSGGTGATDNVVEFKILSTPFTIE